MLIGRQQKLKVLGLVYVKKEELIFKKLYYRKIKYTTSNKGNFKAYLQ